MTDEAASPENAPEEIKAPEAPETPAAPPVAETSSVDAATPVAIQEVEPPKPRASDGAFLGVGRRKSAVARVRLRKGEGRYVVNGRDFTDYFRNEKDRSHAMSALKSSQRETDYDLFVRVAGGGMTGQSGAILMGTARALIKAEPALEAGLRKEGFMTRDARMVERKKYGRRGARRSFQFSKR